VTTTVATAAPRHSTVDKRLRIAIAVLSLVGIGIGVYLTYVHYEKIKVLCLSSGGCETVQSSSYAKLVGIPVATLGLAGYVGIFASAWIRNELGRLAGFGLALLGFLFSMYLTYRELFTIKAICQWCVGSAVLMTLLAILTTIRVLRDDIAPVPAAVNGHKTIPRAERRRQMAKARR
jgi:uncharacterized membrane protein